MALPYCLALTCLMIAVGSYSQFKRRILVYSRSHAEMFIVAHFWTCFVLQGGQQFFWLALLFATTVILLIYYFSRRMGHAYSFPGIREDALKQSVAQVAADSRLNTVMSEDMTSLTIDEFIIDILGGYLSTSTVRARTVSGNSVLRQVVSVLKTHYYLNPKILSHWRLVWDVFLWVSFVWIALSFHMYLRIN